VPLNFTAVAPVKVVPVMVTAVVFVPLVGEKELIWGSTLKLVELVAAPTVLVTLIGPLVAPAGTVVRSCVSERAAKPAMAPLKAKPVVPVKWVPVMVTVAPTAPLVGENELMVGAAVELTVKLVELAPVPLGVVTLILPVVAPPGTLVEIPVPETTVKVAGVPLNFTAVVPVKVNPVIVTAAPSAPLVGEKAVIFGVTTKFVELVTVPPGVVTATGPVVAATGTLVLI
jgi:hypothetical protein